MDWHARTVENINEELSTSLNGLSASAVQKRLLEFGLNRIAPVKPKSNWAILISQLKSPIVYLLIAASAVSFLFEEIAEAVAIVFVIVINTAIGFFMERQASRSMEALRKFDIIRSRVLRDGVVTEIDAAQLVPGDILLIEAGDLIAADARLVQCAQLRINESALTGESLSADKSPDTIEVGSVLADRTNMVYKGTSAVHGNGKAIVIATGIKTELGNISQLTQAAQKEKVPLNEKLESFSRKLIGVIVVIILPFVGLSIIQQRDIYLTLETAISLAVAAIPEGLPIVATISLARGMLKLAKQNVVVKKLAAVETLGETNVIFTDKTGTLTENKLEAGAVYTTSTEIDIANSTSDDPDLNGDFIQGELDQITTAVVLCNNAYYSAEGSSGDPLEVALLKFAGEWRDAPIEEIKQSFPRVEEVAFDSDSRVMAVLSRGNGDYLVTAKGATEELLALCSHELKDGRGIMLDQIARGKWLSKTDQMGLEGLKVIGIANRSIAEPGSSWLADLTFLGLVALLDPPRADVPDAIAACRVAGIRVIMVTGDHSATAQCIASKVKLVGEESAVVMNGAEIPGMDNLTEAERERVKEVSVFSRVSPQQKLDLVNLYKKDGAIVAMTGDGVNDAPALKAADIGIAMGIRGTQVAQEAADIVLKDDAFPSIANAIRQGRVIFGNIERFVVYLMSCNLTEIMVVTVAAFVNLAMPLQPLQILFLNLITDVFPALALGMGKGSNTVMLRKPRQSLDFLIDRKKWTSIIIYAVVMSLSVLGVFFYGLYELNLSNSICNNIAFMTLAFAQLLHPLNLASRREHFLRNNIVSNPYLWGAVLFCTVIIVSVFYIPYTSEVLSLQLLDQQSWLLIAIGAVAPVVLIQTIKRLGLLE